MELQKEKKRMREKNKEQKARGLMSAYRPVDQKSARRKIVMGAAEFCKYYSAVIDAATRASEEGATALGTSEEFLLPGVFSNLIKKQFRISLSPAELGATGEFVIYCMFSFGSLPSARFWMSFVRK
jgi:hypothetical protein